MLILLPIRSSGDTFHTENSPYSIGFYGTANLYEDIKTEASSENVDLNIEYYMHPGSTGNLYYANVNNNRLYNIKQMNEVLDNERYSSFFRLDPNISHPNKANGAWSTTLSQMQD